ncbi:MAG: hypothetical protein C4584_01295 [Armatimonadetes bacterium]|nr:MAG: hypothetical protein C4584_01295 [Armatimonadota bacterium]
MKNLHTFSDYDIHFFGSGVENSPDRIIRQDNNKQLLGTCVIPKTMQELQNLAIAISDKQIQLLQKWRLLKIHNRKLKTAFPIINKNQISQLRKCTQVVARKILQTIEPDVSDFTNKIKQQKQINPYLLFFSYIMDNLAWDHFSKIKAMPDFDYKDGLWWGMIWGTSTPRSFFLGTNGYNYKGGNLQVVWNYDLLPLLEPLFLHPEKIPQALKGLTIPALFEQPKDPIYQSSLKLSKKLAETVLAYLDLPNLTLEYKLPDIKQALIIIYHEIIWDILKEVEETGLLIRPKIINKPENIKKDNLTDLMFLIQPAKAV